jgi:hypothetical protein
MAEIELGPETPLADPPGGWSYPVTVFADGRTHQLHVTLSYQDYDFWSHGRVGPSRVVEAVVRYLVDQTSAESVMQKFDCSVARRVYPDIDRDLPSLL